MKRLFDLFFACVLLVFLAVPMLIIAILVSLTSKGQPIYWSDRVGKNNIIFKMPKFRTMLIDSPTVATHLLDDPDSYLSPIGGLLRNTSLDEIPQLFSVLKGDISFVGPRPALFNQADLIALRKEKGVDKLSPGITGWAQVNGLRGATPNPENMRRRMEHDLWYLNNWTVLLDLYIILKTFYIIFKHKGD